LTVFNRGWDDIFTKCGENLNSLVAMKLSPYYKVFEEEVSSYVLWPDIVSDKYFRLLLGRRN
jgi:hypothetical protein